MRSPSALAWLLRKEWRALMASSSWWTMLVLIGPLVGVSFISATRTYPELSVHDAAAGVGEAFSPLIGVWAPTFSACELAAAFLLPFVAIRVAASDRMSGAPKIELQRPLSLAVRIGVKTLVLMAGWISPAQNLMLRVNVDRMYDTNPNDAVAGTNAPTVARRYTSTTYTRAGSVPFTIGESRSSDLFSRQVQFADALSWSRGRHTLRFGGSVIHHESGGTGSEPGQAILGTFTFLTTTTQPFEQLTLADVQQYAQPIDFGVSSYELGQWMSMGFVQDNIRVSSQLTVDAGLRYDRQTLTDATTNFAPRLGFGWHPGSA